MDFKVTEKPSTLPEHPREPLCKVSDGTSANHYYFRDKFASVADVSAPGYFDFMRDSFTSGSNKGVIHMILCHLGEIADGLTAVDLHVVDAPRSIREPVIMAVGAVQKFAPPKADKKVA
jgi:hypothetical protein